MKEFIKGITFSISGILVIMLYIGCTPGKAQTRANDYKGNFSTEEYEAFDTVDNTGDDSIPKYGNNNRQVRSSNSGNNYRPDYSGNRNNNGNLNRSGNNTSNNGYNRSGNSGYNNMSNARSGQGNQGQHRGFDVADDNSGYSGNGYVRNVNNSNQFRNDRFYQKGAASWYGREFHGKVTASGERFDMNNFTAAHKTLPFGTILEVRNLQNGRSVRIKVNDRGPYRGNRVIDLSFRAAKELDMIKVGTASVGINVIKMGSAGATYGNSNKSRYVEPVADRNIDNRSSYSRESDYGSANIKLQAGAFYSRNNAEKLKSRIEMRTDKPVRIVRDGDFFKVRVEGLRSSEEAARVKEDLKYERISSFIIE